VEAFTEAGVPVSCMIVAYKQSSNIANVTQRNCSYDMTNAIPNQGPAS
jgi:hypothetical protein